MTGRVVLLIVGALAIVGVALVSPRCRAQIERHVEEPAANSTHGPYRALDLLLEGLDVRVKKRSHWRELPPHEAALWIFADRASMTEAEANRLLTWVEGGGHLVIVTNTISPDEDGNPADLLLHWLGIEVLPGADEQVLLEFPRSVGEPLIVSFEGHYLMVDVAILEDPEADWVEWDFYEIGLDDGTVTILSDTAFLTNSRIGELDHAAFAWELLVRSDVRRPELWLVQKVRAPSLASLVIRHAPLVVLSGLLLVALWIWRASHRFGPISAGPPPERRAVVEHIAAAGEFFGRAGLLEMLAGSVRSRLLRAARRRLPGFARWSERERIVELAQVGGVAPGILARALSPGGCEDRADFTQAVSVLERTRQRVVSRERRTSPRSSLSSRPPGGES